MLCQLTTDGSGPGHWVQDPHDPSPSKTTYFFSSHIIKDNGHQKYSFYKEHTYKIQFFQSATSVPDNTVGFSWSPRVILDQDKFHTLRNKTRILPLPAQQVPIILLRVYYLHSMFCPTCLLLEASLRGVDEECWWPTRNKSLRLSAVPIDGCCLEYKL